MSNGTNIEWTDATWNPVTGCTEVSAGCDNCYAKTFAERWRGVPGHHFEQGFDVVLRPERLDEPLHWRKPRRVFVNSMSDLFHDAVPDRFIGEVFTRMGCARQHTFQLLTKRHGRMRSLLRRWSEHRPRGGTCPDDDGCSAPVDAIPPLLETPAAVRWVSAEPLLGPVDLTRWLAAPGGLSWVVVGGESGPGARPMHPGWARALRDQCGAASVAYLFKQTGSVLARQLGIRSKGGDWNALPLEFQIRQYPQEVSRVS
jgi:protein gp37